MNEMIFASNKALYLVLMMSAWPIIVATVIGLLVGLFQTVTQLQEQTLPFGIKLFGVSLCLFMLSGWYGETLLGFGREVMRLALRHG
ncbi:EscS/YscS/HrcS family type III secretion system export apparatus protein [Chromobacterium piscinae]|uniref:EscS/YscS/HrcS family type III secretion system export apparatus protein n=1 Tax=Chromobacterium piscinae TaxID=686831 RepID=A0ABV0H826_9NEIS|nr:EscS/YscS/HrcS family type III secretion system export apparatus protein [Chromobacterium piscinae]MBX9295506.1 EscS/YscS/HrcS family type III secretion system export apparatus protein [Chromobacterium vaccinii]MBX9346848.1 EscS/YscS/HrcS family type III secretion system export apparatus protein [Chromobacterium vaccinii]MBX9355814.1 EscS/YscS/HrcS family type III secretion system export apparatus protein [Chromobacterium vaccinii]MCD4505112.1 EscS/YscS/HrcS family type III secretion system 